MAGLVAQVSNDACANAINLCPGVTYSGGNVGATVDTCAGCSDGAAGAGNFCFELNNSVWFSFQTNSLGGNADVNISNLDCLTGVGQDNELQAVVIEAGTPCDESTYNAVSNCEVGSSPDFTLSAAGLASNTTYYVQIDGDIAGSNIAAECDFSIQVTGQAVEVTATTTITDEDCAQSNGVIEVTAVNGGNAPYTYSIDNGSTFQANNTFNGLTSGTYDLVIQDANNCILDITSDPEVETIGGPSGSLTVITDANCNANDGQIEVIGTAGGTTPYSYSLNGGAQQGSNSFQNLSAGSYTIIVEDDQGCQEEITALVSNTTGPTNATITPTDPSCDGNDGSIAISPVGGQAPYTYLLNGGAAQASGTFSGLAAGTYEVLITDANGCTFLVSGIELTEAAPDVVPSIAIQVDPSPACVGDQVTVTAFTQNQGANPDFEFFVNGNSVQAGNNNTYTASLNDGDQIQAVLTSNENCLAVNPVESNLETLQVLPYDDPIVTITSDTNDICSGFPVTFAAEQNGCTDPIYEWYVNGLLQQSSNDSSYTSPIFQDGVDIYCEVTCNSPCSNTGVSNVETITVNEVSADAGPDVVIAQEESTQLNGTGNGTFSWSPTESLSNPNSEDPVASPSTSTVYTLTVTNNGCTATDEVIVQVNRPIYPPNTFTPNGDGVNDTWTIGNIHNYPNCSVTIYDRWGQKVYNSIGYTNQKAWDGTNRGLALPAATYYYVIDLKTPANREFDLFMGSITIVY